MLYSVNREWEWWPSNFTHKKRVMPVILEGVQETKTGFRITKGVTIHPWISWLPEHLFRGSMTSFKHLRCWLPLWFLISLFIPANEHRSLCESIPQYPKHYSFCFWIKAIAPSRVCKFSFWLATTGNTAHLPLFKTTKS